MRLISRSTLRMVAFTTVLAGAAGVRTGAAQSAAAPPNAHDTTTYTMDAVTEKPTLVNNSEAARVLATHYPAALRDHGVTGEVHLLFRITAEGAVDTASLRVTFATNPEFGDVAQRVVKTMRFTPPRLNGTPVAVWVDDMPVQFSLVEGPLVPSQPNPMPRPGPER